MNLGFFRARSAAFAGLLLCFGLSLLGFRGAMGQTQSQSGAQSQPQTQAPPQTQTQSGSSAAPTTAADDAAAKAAERKRKFDEQRKLLESGVVPPKDGPRRNADPDLMFSPMEANLLVHEQLSFRLYDKGNVEVTGKGSYSGGPTKVVNFYIVKGLPTVVAAGPGTATLAVSIDRRYAFATITVYPGDKLPKGVQSRIDAIPQR